MKRIIFLVPLVAFVPIVWNIINTISSDALALAIGVVFGMLAGVPTAFLVLAERRNQQPQPQPQPPTYNVVILESELTNESEQLRIIDGEPIAEHIVGRWAPGGHQAGRCNR